MQGSQPPWQTWKINLIFPVREFEKIASNYGQVREFYHVHLPKRKCGCDISLLLFSFITRWHIFKCWIIMIGCGGFLVWKSLLFCLSLFGCGDWICPIPASWNFEKSSGKIREVCFYEMLGTLGWSWFPGGYCVFGEELSDWGGGEKWLCQQLKQFFLGGIGKFQRGDSPPPPLKGPPGNPDGHQSQYWADVNIPLKSYDWDYLNHVNQYLYWYVVHMSNGTCAEDIYHVVGT